MGAPPPPYVHLTRAAVDEAAVTFLAQQPFTHAVTLTYNEALSGPCGSPRRFDPRSGRLVETASSATPRPASGGTSAHRDVTFEQFRRDFARFDAVLHRHLMHQKFHRMPGHRRLA